GFGIRDSGFGIRDSGFGIRDSGFGIRDSTYFVFLGTSSVNTFLIKIPFLYTLNEYLSIPKAKRSQLSERSVSLSRISKDEVRSRSEAFSNQKSRKTQKAATFLLRLF
ncbi:hypothetical protein, partial [Vibrio campbellii]|uniref:hypothetical protein n=1 Tax=Vibrio campbellii TaxID=680 RepID=UPI001D1925A1